MELTIATNAHGGGASRSVVRDAALRLLIGRLRVGLWVSLVAIALFALADLALANASQLALLAVLKLLQVGVIAASFQFLHRPPSARTVTFGVVAAAVLCVTTGAGGVIRHDYATTPLLLVTFTMGTATLLPWGMRAQLVMAGVAAATMLMNVALVSGGLAPLFGYPSGGVVAALLGSLYIAYDQDRRRADAEQMSLLVAGQTEVLERIAGGATLAETLARLSLMIEDLAPDLLCSVLLLDGDRLRHGAAPSLPDVYNQAIDGIVIGPEVGSCGTAAFTRLPVVVTDTAADPLWRNYRDLALAHGLRACWSAPIIATDGRCLGTFAMYYREPRSPGEEDWARIEIATHLARVAIERRRAEVELAASRARLEEESQVAGALAQVGREMMSCLSTPLILERLCRITTEVLACDCSDTALRDPRDDAYVPNSAYGYAPEQWEALRVLRMPAALLAELVATLARQPLVQVRTKDVQDARVAGLLETYGVTVSMYVALRRGDRILGILSAGYRGRDERFTPAQRRIAIGIAQLASMALENARLLEELRTANQLKSEFVSTMSHELRTPLNVIMGYTEMLEENLEPTEHEQALARIRSSSFELLELIETTLNLNRLEGGRDPATLENVRVEALFDELAAEFAPLTRRTVTALRWELAGPVEILTDRRKLKIVVKNLVGNAVKFTPAGEVVVSCRLEGGRCAITVRDTGIGIAAEHLPVIFEMFRQADSSDTRSYSGVGLGLYIVRRLLVQLGGEVHVESTPGHGSTFKVTLPAAGEPALRAMA